LYKVSSLNAVERLRENKAWTIVITTLRRVEGWLVFIVLFTVFANALLRYIFKISFLWSEEVLLIIALWMYFIGAIIGAEEESHIKGDMIGGLFSKPKSRKLHKVIVALYSALVICIIAVWVVQYCVWQTELGTVTTNLRWPKVTSIYSVGFGCVGMAAYFTYHFIRYSSMKPCKFAKGVGGEVQ